MGGRKVDLAGLEARVSCSAEAPLPGPGKLHLRRELLSLSIVVAGKASLGHPLLSFEVLGLYDKFTIILEDV